MAMGSQHVQLLQAFKKVIPPLLFDTHKGEAGRIGVVGGSEEYTGAPIFAGMAAFRTGADLVHVFCAKNAAIPIKSFSPDLIVHPILVSSNELIDFVFLKICFFFRIQYRLPMTWINGYHVYMH